MGYAHGIRWTSEKIEKEIIKVMNTLSIKRMPSRSEIELVTRNTSLSNKIAKTGGFNYWANMLGIEMKKSETTFGNKYENLIKRILEAKGYKVEKMTTKHPYDLLVNDYIKIDVKVAMPYECESVGKFHSYNLEKKNPTCDIYIVIALSKNEAIERTLIIPSKYLKVTQLSIGKNSKYNQYADRWDFIEKYDKFYKHAI